MNRKVIKQGNNTLTITLPRSWAEKWGVKAGDELAVEDKNKRLVINSGQTKVQSKIEIDITGMDGSSICLILRGLYRRGYDTIILRSNDKEIKHLRTGNLYPIEEVITTEVNRLMGFELFNIDRNSFEIRSISTEPFEDFENTLRRIFLFTLQYQEDFLHAIKKKDTKLLQGLVEKPLALHKFPSYATRLLNKKGHPEQDYAPFLYDLIESLELINDCVKDSVRFSLSNKVKFGDKSIKIIEEIGEAVKFYYESYYKFSFKKFAEYIGMRERIIAGINGSFKEMDKGEMAVVAQMGMILDLIRESLRVRVSLL